MQQPDTAPAITPEPTPVPESQPPVPASTPAPAEPTNLAQARAALREPVKPEAPLPPRDVVGKFTKPPEAGEPLAVEGQPAPDTPPAAEAGEPGAPVEAQPDTVPAGFVRIEIPPGPLQRSFGTEQIVPEAAAEFTKWNLNNIARRSEVETLRTRQQELEDWAMRLQAENDSLRSYAGQIADDPEIIEQANEIERVYGPEAKARYLAGLTAEQQAQIDTRYDELQGERLAAANERVAGAFLQDALKLAPLRYDGWQQENLKQAIAAYGSFLDAQGRTDPSVEDFYRYADGAYWATPGIRERWDAKTKGQREAQEKQREEALRAAERKRIEDEERQRLEAQAEQRQQYPWRNVPAGSANNAVRGTDGQPSGPATVAEARKALRRF